MSDGVKYNAGKAPMRRLGIVPKALEGLARVLDYGAKKYPEADNWRRVTPFRESYSDALERHVMAYLAGEETDAESGLPHLAHVMANASFLLEGPASQEAKPSTGLLPVGTKVRYTCDCANPSCTWNGVGVITSVRPESDLPYVVRTDACRTQPGSVDEVKPL